ncbi:Pleckstrin homology domain-containing family M member 3 [Armadillidium nasatum]|uniref:Pleckstrin homology domain-containing family M member 3 n=1 Tax=Armadillidium nasatum TaxID=96803 RepID=A0A5N5TFR0_9CRUS|nr:Pleckstrin homology domain-containing family M member 3 [Armadillidium nasatum]
MLSFHSKRDRREAVIRATLLEQLKESIQSLIYGPGGENVPKLSSSGPKGQVLGHTDNTNALCCILEALFIHGLKDTLGEKLSSMFSGDLDRMPVPNFWMVVMVISHRDLIEQVSSLSFIMSDVGKSRAWMRLALNQGQLVSYLSVLASDPQTLKDYYRPTAFLSDTESCDIMIRILQPLSGIAFNLATNAAVLNTWSQTPLILSGIWIPTNYEQSTFPVLSATDVASTFIDDSEEPGIAIPQTPLSDQMFDLIIGGTPETRFINESIDYSERDIIPALNVTECEIPNEKSAAGPSVISESKSPPVDSFGALSLEKDFCESALETSSQAEEDTQSVERERRLSSMTVQSEREDSIMNRSISVVSDTNEYRNLIADWEASDAGENLPAFLTTNTTSYCLPENLRQPVPKEMGIPEEDSDYEFLSTHLPSESEMSGFLPFLTILMNEKGMDYQNYQCSTPGCAAPIGIIYGKPRVCKYDGKYYCYECHQGDTSIIPARVIHNWDFSLYPVCTLNKKWLDTVMMHPLLDIRLVNPKLYQHFEELSELQVLRIQLHFIQAYLFTCSVDKGQELRKLFWPREHLYEHVHLYSVFDLKQTNEKKLVPLARKAVTTGRKCQICYVRGFIAKFAKI